MAFAFGSYLQQFKDATPGPVFWGSDGGHGLWNTLATPR